MQHEELPDAHSEKLYLETKEIATYASNNLKLPTTKEAPDSGHIHLADLSLTPLRFDTNRILAFFANEIKCMFPPLTVWTRGSMHVQTGGRNHEMSCQRRKVVYRHLKHVYAAQAYMNDNSYICITSNACDVKSTPFVLSNQPS
jgi:hypothetical protein